MKIFFRSHLALLLIVFAQGGFTWLYFWFLGFQGWGHILYVSSMQLLFIFAYLAYRWIEDYKLYKWINSNNENKFIPSFGTSYFTNVLHRKVLEEKSIYDQIIMENDIAIQEKVTFMNQWVHQMKTPISVIHLMIQDQDENVFQDIRKELYRLEEGLKTVLYSSRLTMFEKDYFIETITLQALLKEILEENKRLFIQFGVYPNLILDEQDISIVSDQKWIKFVIEQILSNAVKYSTGKSNKVDIKVVNSNEKVMCTITDYGIGIPPQDLKRVFDPYFTGVNGRNYHESTGMGLYLVKEILHKLSHKFQIYSEVDHGTSFSISFNVKE
ncbi:sensor histidine kinase [Cytobacillus sp. IB215665]|uniref:sensor histidine kinase n=1 Tax=Cytobacillus sp. IB215665 TaxID=3097357 RepID=UPI002A1482E2|nr:sensor histidine kinase [Cytobacillus sp. IB215665]MDX8367220.1 sensor histidine kinase [Cytobacillus sp. IB215665]